MNMTPYGCAALHNAPQHAVLLRFAPQGRASHPAVLLDNTMFRLAVRRIWRVE